MVMEELELKLHACSRFVVFEHCRLVFEHKFIVINIWTRLH